jgi:hypothetical protein
MAAEQFTGASAPGRPAIAGSGAEPPPPEFPDLHEALGEFQDALCVLEIVCLALEAAMEDPPEHFGAYAVSLRHSFMLLDAVYSRFDKGLVGLDCGRESDDDTGAAR